MSGKSRYSLLERLAMKTEPGPNGCLLFTGPVDKQGYARIYDGVEKRLVHRVAYTLHVGPIPEGLQIDHLCRVRHCVNPEHLEAVTPLVNTMRSSAPSAVNAAKTHCIHGHPFSSANTRVHRYRDGSLSRICRRCDADRAAAWRARRAAA